MGALTTSIVDAVPLWAQLRVQCNSMITHVAVTTDRLRRSGVGRQFPELSLLHLDAALQVRIHRQPCETRVCIDDEACLCSRSASCA